MIYFGVIRLFFRTERSVKEFMYAYPVIFTILLLNVALWIVNHLLPFDFGKMIYTYGIGNNYFISEYGEYWRIITPIFLHARGLSHVLLNSIALIIFAPPLEQILGKIKFIIMYLLAGTIGNIGTFIMDPQSLTFHVGASGAIYGIFGMYIFMVFFRRYLIDQTSAQIIFTISAIGIVTTFIIPGINISAHIFGFLGGFAIAPFFLIGAKPFSIYRNKKPPAYEGPGGVAFDPNRWKKRRRISNLLRINNVWIWFFLIVLIVFLLNL